MDELAADRRNTVSSPPPMPPLPLPPDDLLLEILLRLPPEPIYLFRASSVSKHWRGLVHDARFLRRYRDFHGGTPPVLGYFKPGGPTLFVPTSAGFAPSAATMSREDWWLYDCRHGRALLDSHRTGSLLVWDLMTGEERSLPFPVQAHRRFVCNAAVLCAAGHGDDRGVCRSCPFLVALVFSTHTDPVTHACVYSSETGVWGGITSIQLPHSLVRAGPTVLAAGNTLYWLLNNYSIMEYDLDNHSLDLIGDVPYVDDDDTYSCQGITMRAEDGGLGFAQVHGFRLHLWSRVATTTGDGVASWTHRRVIDLDMFLAPQLVEECMLFQLAPVGYAEDAGVIFIDLGPSIYMIHLKSMKIQEVPQKGTPGYIFPYTSFYAPGITIGGGDDQDELLNGN